MPQSREGLWLDPRPRTKLTLWRTSSIDLTAKPKMPPTLLSMRWLDLDKVQKMLEEKLTFLFETAFAQRAAYLLVATKQMQCATSGRQCIRYRMLHLLNITGFSQHGPIRSLENCGKLARSDIIAENFSTLGPEVRQIETLGASGIIFQEIPLCRQITLTIHMILVEAFVIRRTSTEIQGQEKIVVAKCRTPFFVGTCFGLIACFLTWLLMTETSSPLQSYLQSNPALRNFWGELNFPIYAVAMVLGLPDSSVIGYLLIFLEWFFVGSLGYFILALLFRRP